MKKTTCVISLVASIFTASISFAGTIPSDKNSLDLYQQSLLFIGEPPVSIVGTWRQIEIDNDFFSLSFFEDGSYLYAATGYHTDPNATDGMEWGTYSRDATGLMTVTQDHDDNEGTGLSDFTGTENLYIQIAGDVLTVIIDGDGNGEFDEPILFQRATSDGILGTWRNTETENDFLSISFFDDDTYLHAEVDLDDATEISGMEWGPYTHNESTGLITATQTFDGNGDTGLNDFSGIADLFVHVSGDLLTATIDENGDGTIDQTIIFQRQ